MEYNGLIELKSEVDELSLFYHALKNREEELEEILYSNNIIDVDKNIQKNNIEGINEYISNNRLRFTLKWLVIYMIIYTILIVFKDMGLPKLVYYILVGCNLSFYSSHILLYESIARKKYKKKHQKTTIDIDQVKSEYDAIKNKIAETKKIIYDKSLKYNELVGKLNEEEYYNYLEYLNTYLFEMLEDSVDILSEVEANIYNETDDELSYRLKER